ncbi:hypothetical protein [Peribacillus sp. NPDC096540]|uniref:hypothetical protein n=1 Tax=Peribacillus sp. NPDC096540 TaxID=3390612 RepID=UPI003D052D18
MDDFPYFLYDPDLFPICDKPENMYRKSARPMFRPLTATNPDLLVKSAKTSQSLLLDVKKVVDTIATSMPFSTRLMTAAQESKKTVVMDMIRKTGVKTVPDIMYNPDGIRFHFHSIGDENSHIIVSLKWRNM